MVFEEAFLFSDTIRANIAYGRPDATRRRGARPPRGPRRCTRSSTSCPTATTPWSASAGSRSPAGSGSGSRWPGPCSPTRGCWCSTTPRPRSTPPPRPRSTRRCARSPPGRTTLLVAHRRSTLALADRIAVLDARPGGRRRHGGRADRALRAVPRAVRASAGGRGSGGQVRRCRAERGHRRSCGPTRIGPGAERADRPAGSRGRASGGGAGMCDRRAARRHPGAAGRGRRRCRRPRERPGWPARTPTAPDPGFRLARLLRPVRGLARAGRAARRARRAERAGVPRPSPGSRSTAASPRGCPASLRDRRAARARAGRRGELAGGGRCRRWSPRGPGRACSTCCACAATRTCSGSGSTTTSASCPAGS